MSYELWSKTSGNALGGYKTEAAALAVVARIVARHGSAGARDLFLGMEDTTGDSHLIAEGQALVDRALAATDTRVPA